MTIPLPASAGEPWLAGTVWLLARATLLLLAAAAVAGLLQRRSAAARHLVWALSLLGLLALPGISLVAPHWKVPFVSVPLPVSGFAAVLPAAAGAPGVDWGTLVLLVWAIGGGLALGRYALALAGVAVLARRASAVTDPDWLARLREAAAELGLRTPVRLLRSAGAAMPMTWGVLRPTVLIPADADGWSAERRRVVLLHELAHVARRDCLWQTVASLCCAAYWFHPGAWWAARQMRVEREQACDDRVLGAGTRASDYAGHLLDVARGLQPHLLTAPAAVAMARRSQLEERVLAVLDAARTRAAVPARVALLATAAGALFLLPLASAAPVAVPPPELAAVQAALARARETASSPASDGRREGRAQAGADARQMAPSRTLAAPEGESVIPELTRRDPATLTALVRATGDDNPEVRRNAVWALSQMESGDAVVASLVYSMGDPDPRVRSAAVRALGEYAGRQYVLDAERGSLAQANEQRKPKPPVADMVAVAEALSLAMDIQGSADDPALRILEWLAAPGDTAPGWLGSGGLGTGALDMEME